LLASANPISSWTPGEGGSIKGPTDVGTRRGEKTEVPLSQIIDILNERFGTSFTQADQLFFDQVKAQRLLAVRVTTALSSSPTSASDVTAFMSGVRAYWAAEAGAFTLTPRAIQRASALDHRTQS
jgi:hypothetical protein